MSYLLNQIDNNRSEDDEDDHINRLFPKCIPKPRASSLSLSPSLQHITHESPSSTSASELCLTSSNYSLSPSKFNLNLNNSNLLSPLNAIITQNQYSNRRHSANSNQFNDSILNSVSQQSRWNQEEFTIFSSKEAQIAYENNNIENSDNLWAVSSETVNPSEKTFSHSTDRGHTHRSVQLKHKCGESHANNHQKISTKGHHKCDISRGGMNISATSLQSTSGCHSFATQSSNYFPTTVSKPEKEIKENKSGVSDENFSSVISHRPQVGLCSAKRACALQPLSSSPLLQPLRKMELNSVEDSFDNGIGSRSSGESTHSTTSDFNLVSPVAGIRGRVASSNGGGIKGQAAPILTPSSMGSLRDSRIIAGGSLEIAGGREIYSQNRIRASRRHRGSSHAISTEMMAETALSTKMRKKSLHSHTPYQHQQHHHCCPHSSSCCGTTTNNCAEVTLSPHGSLVWEPNNHNCRRATEAIAGNRQQYLSHSHSFGGISPHVKCTESTSSPGCCGHHGSFDYPKVASSEFDGGNRVCRNIPNLRNSSPTSPMTVRETIFASEVRSIEKSTPRGPQVADKPSLLHCELASPCRIEPVIYEAVVGDGKVVFDDIGEWRERVGDNGGYDGGDEEHDTSVESQGSKKRQMQAASVSASKDGENPMGVSSTHAIQRVQRSAMFGSNNGIEPLECSPCTSNRDGNTTPSGYESDECSASCTNTSILSSTNLKNTSPNFGNKRLIGNIPIAEYEGSPKRYGLKQTLHPVTTHFDLIDVDIGAEVTRVNDQVINDSNAQNLMDQTIAAATSSSSSSLDNTNTNLSSNSSSRTNNRVSPLSPSQPISAFSRIPGFPGFPQRVNPTSSTPNSQDNTRTQPCPLLEYSDSNKLASANHELLPSVNKQSLAGSESRSNNLAESEISYLGGQSSSSASVTTEQLIRIEASPLPDEVISGSYNQPPLSSTSDQHASLQCNLLEDNFLINPLQMRTTALDPRNQDFLYEFSETRKVLEEFFNVTGGSQGVCRGSGGQFLAEKASFDELDYMLKRQAGNSYVGMRLSDIAGNLPTEDSPKKPRRHGVLVLGSSDGDGSDEKGSPKFDFISFQEEILLPQPVAQQQHSRASRSLTTSSSVRSPRSSLKTHSRPQSQSPPLHDINDNDIDAETASTNTETDLGETVGLQVGRGRNFALSPETTDCDSNELESELDYEASLHSSCRAGGMPRPVVVDGLSSGNESENEDIIEVDVGFQEDDCYLMGDGKIKPGFTPGKGQNDMSSDAKLYSCEDNKENILDIIKSDTILSWANSDDLIANIQDESKVNSGEPNPTLMLMKKQISEIEKEIQLRASQHSQKCQPNGTGMLVDTEIDMNDKIELPESATATNTCLTVCGRLNGKYEQSEIASRKNPFSQIEDSVEGAQESIPVNHDPELDALDPMRPTPPPSPAPGYATSSHLKNRSEPMPVVAAGGEIQASNSPPSASVTAAIQDIKEAIQRAKPLSQPRHSSVSSTPASSAPCSSSHCRSGLVDSQQPHQSPVSQERVPLICDSPVWVPRRHQRSNRNRDPRADSQGAKDPLLKKQRYDDNPDDDANTDTDTETDRLLGQTRTEDDCGFFDEKDWKKPKARSLLPSLNKGAAFVSSIKSAASPSQAPLLSTSASISGGGNNSIHPSCNSFNPTIINNSFTNTNNASTAAVTNSSSQHLIHPLSPTTSFDDSQVQLSCSTGPNAASKSKKQQEKDGTKKKRSKEDLTNPSVLIEGVLFRARYLGSTQLTCEGQPTKATRMMQAEEAVSRIKAEGTNELQQALAPPSTSVAPGTGPSSLGLSMLTSQPQPISPLTFAGANEFQNSAVCSLSMRKNIEISHGNEMKDYYYGPEEEEESCCDGESDVDENLFAKGHHSRDSVRDNEGMALQDIQDSANTLQSHDNHIRSLSLHHNRQSSGNGETCLGGEANLPTSIPNVSPPSPPSVNAQPGTMFRLRFVGSMEVDEEIGSGKRRRKRRPKKIMVEEAVMKMKSMAPEGDTQPSTEVDLFISTEKIMVLNTDLKEIMMDHALRTISYIADIGDLVVLMARRRPVPTDDPIDDSKPARLPKMICHVFESDEAQYIAQSIGQAFQVAYMEFLKANGIEDSSFVREMDYQEVLNSQEIFGDELQMFAKKELQKEVVVPKSKGEILGVVIVESGWGSMLPTVVIANLAPAGAFARCGHLNIGDQIIAINGVSLVGLPLSACQNYIKNTKNQTVVKVSVVPCPPVVEVKIKRPDTKYQLGFSVQNGVICSLLRGGIAERGGVRVGHRIIEINSQSVVAVPHEKIVNLLATSVGEINMKTMPTSMFRLLTGQENPLYI